MVGTQVYHALTTTLRVGFPQRVVYMNFAVIGLSGFCGMLFTIIMRYYTVQFGKFECQQLF